ncbi:hypothetical protein INT44_005252 [Umbelopsis vinacea]|uniref:SET domain-containing protein n=1 Tax=Umbelopsis vinacea TaxID=44442 RepID=A0A8H7Q817_9FUNG|nr:hypothetical protein INT44_005252 [Umbelopsis vinacea]
MPKNVFDRQPFDNGSGVQQVTDLFRAIDRPRLSKRPETDHQNRSEAIFEKFGFRLSVKPSTLPGAGNGVYLNGMREKGQIVGVYPGLSARIHRSLHKRDNWPGAIVTSDDTWLTVHPRNPLAVGQIVNNNRFANVRYQEIDIPGDFPLELRKYIPNLYLSDQSIESNWRLVALIATRRIEDEELFSTYFECVY